MTRWPKEMIDDYAQKAIFDLDDYSQIRQRVVPKVYARLKKRPIAASRLLMIMNIINASAISHASAVGKRAQKMLNAPKQGKIA